MQIRVLKKFLERPVMFDHIIIETTGLADPAPVAQVCQEMCGLA
jgi:G3E family GTPase